MEVCGKGHSKEHLGAMGQLLCPHCGFGAIGYTYCIGDGGASASSFDWGYTKKWYH